MKFLYLLGVLLSGIIMAAAKVLTAQFGEQPMFIIGKVIALIALFGYDWFNHFCQKHDCDIIALNNPSLSSEEELTQDLLTILHVFFK